MFDVEDVSLSFGDRVMLDHVTFRLGPADRIGLLGPNGAGKTTFLKVLTGQLPPDRGMVKQGKTVRVANLSQTLEEIDGTATVLRAHHRRSVVRRHSPAAVVSSRRRSCWSGSGSPATS